MKNCDLQCRLLSETFNPADALNQAIIDEKGYYSHPKLTNMTRSSMGNSGRVYKKFNTVKKEPSLNIEKSDTCMKWWKAFTKGHLNVCPAKEIICNICKYKGHFGRLYKSKWRRNIALQLSNRNSGEVWFSNLDLKLRSQLQLCTDTRKQGNFSLVGGETTGTYRFSTGFYGLGDMPNDCQRVMDSLLKDFPFTNCYVNDILIASKWSLNEHKAILLKILFILDSNNMAVKWENCTLFQKDIECLGFKISHSRVKPLVGKSDSVKSLPNPKMISELRSFFGSINHKWSSSRTYQL